MSYSVTLASVAEAHIEAFRADRTLSLQASHIVCCSHFIAGMIGIQPLGDLITEAVDGGENLAPNLAYFFRPPVFQTKEDVRRIFPDLAAAHKECNQASPVPIADDNWWEVQINSVEEIYKWAASRNEAVVSIVGPPYEILAKTDYVPKLT